jgi:hypothetical protein
MQERSRPATRLIYTATRFIRSRTKETTMTGKAALAASLLAILVACATPGKIGEPRILFTTYAKKDCNGANCQIDVYVDPTKLPAVTVDPDELHVKTARNTPTVIVWHLRTPGYKFRTDSIQLKDPDCEKNEFKDPKPTEARAYQITDVHTKEIRCEYLIKVYDANDKWWANDPTIVNY